MLKQIIHDTTLIVRRHPPLSHASNEQERNILQVLPEDKSSEVSLLSFLRCVSKKEKGSRSEIDAGCLNTHYKVRRHRGVSQDKRLGKERIQRSWHGSGSPKTFPFESQSSAVSDQERNVSKHFRRSWHTQGSPKTVYGKSPSMWKK